MEVDQPLQYLRLWVKEPYCLCKGLQLQNDEYGVELPSLPILFLTTNEASRAPIIVGGIASNRNTTG
jgi:hypothetical protein